MIIIVPSVVAFESSSLPIIYLNFQGPGTQTNGRLLTGIYVTLFAAILSAKMSEKWQHMGIQGTTSLCL